MKISSTAVFTLALCVCFALSGCAKKMTDEKFADTAATNYENVKANWDHPAGESWATYYERRIAEACAKNNTEPAAWYSRMNDMIAHPEKYEKLLQKDVIESLIDWEQQRQATKEG
jgi:hypothetical protein